VLILKKIKQKLIKTKEKKLIRGGEKQEKRG